MWSALALVAVAAAAKEPAKKYWDETAHRTVDHSHRDSEHEHYAQQRSRVERAVGVYRFYVYGGGAFDAMTTDLLRGREHTVDDLYVLAEDKVELWTRRALLNDSRRTDDPADADVFFVPAYLTLSTLVSAHDHARRLAAMLAALAGEYYFRRRGGADHVFGYSSTNPGTAKRVGFPDVQKVLNRAWFGAFEMNPAWVGAGRPTPRELATSNATVLDRMVPMPYVVDASKLAGPAARRDTNVHQHEISVFFAANGRPQATKWSGCNRSTALGLKALPKAAIHVSATRARRRRLARRLVDGLRRASDRLFGRRLADTHKVLGESKFAHAMRVSDFCLVMCGDTPTSRRIFDSIVADCVPLIVGTRLWGRCEPPCRPGWGWFVSGEKHPHTPFHDTLIDYSRFPRVDEKWFYEDALAATKAAIANVTSAAELEIWKYLDAIRGDVVYGYGRAATSTDFGRATANLLDGVVLRLRHGGAVPPGLRPG